MLIPLSEVQEYEDKLLFALEQAIHESRLTEEYHHRLLSSPLDPLRVKDIIEATTGNPDLADKRAAQFLLSEMSKENQ